MQENLSKNSKIDYIQGWRGISIILVIFYHYFPEIMKAGYIGVDIFFVISGFVITKSVTSRSRNKYEIFRFYGARVKRIFPSMLIMFLILTLMAVAFLDVREMRSYGAELHSGAIFMYNMIVLDGDDYFNQDKALYLLLNLWSLSIEMQFYMIFPLIFYVLMPGFRKNIFLILCMASFVYSIYLELRGVIGAYTNSFGRVWQIVVGVMLYLHINEVKNACNFFFKLSSTCQQLIEVFLLAGLLLFAVLFSGYDSYPGLWATFPVATILIFLVLGSNSIINQKIVSNRWLVYIGSVSYPLYLWHWPLLSFAFIILGDLIHWKERIVLIFTSFVLAVFSYEIIEKKYIYVEK